MFVVKNTYTLPVSPCHAPGADSPTRISAADNIPALPVAMADVSFKRIESRELYIVA